MADHITNSPGDRAEDADGYIPYDTKRLSYANTFPHRGKRLVIRTMEWCTGKLRLLQLIRRFEAQGVETGQGFWPHALGVMGISLKTPPEEFANIPPSGPVIIVANHPHGLVDGMILAELIGRVRTDYKILTRSLLTGIPEIEQFMIPVPFPHEKNSIQKSLEMRKTAMAHLATGGVIVLFPSGTVATSKGWWGPAIEQDWNPFTAKMVVKSGATVVPIHFSGANSRAYQIADKVSATVRQGLLLHEVVHALNRSQRPHIGKPFDRAEIEARKSAPRELMDWMRAETLKLGAAD
ncbi:lysophospholipid acyltransferase family protein [Rhodobacteraceae bacterium]|nr:lysophospholipid acyltransferase family protein [Paracoccaceae bacterium]